MSTEHIWKFSFRSKGTCIWKDADGTSCKNQAYHICKTHGEILCSPHYRAQVLGNLRNDLTDAFHKR